MSIRSFLALLAEAQTAGQRLCGAALCLLLLAMPSGAAMFHSADLNSDYKISLPELLRVVQFYNAAGYHCVSEVSPSEDGYQPGRNGAYQECAPHNSDFQPQNWRIALPELLRLVQLHNGVGYAVDTRPGSEDGFRPASAEPEAEPRSIWIGPRTFIEGRTHREDFMPQMTDTDNWPTVYKHMTVFKGYIMMLPDVPIPGSEEPEASDAELTALINLLDAAGVEVAFEVGGSRSSEVGAGAQQAANEFTHLSRWLELGGSIDYITTDHAMMRALDTWLEANDPEATGAMSYADPAVRALFDDIYRELVAYFLAMREYIPDVRLGVIESLGYFYVEGPDGAVYRPTRPEIPDLPFCEVLGDLKAAMEDTGLTLDHFHTDYGFEGVQFDGRQTGTLDYGRIIGVETCVRDLGVLTGNIMNAFHDRSVPEPDRETANQEALDHTLQFLEGYMATGLDPDHYVLQTWQPYPDRTGPETEPGTVLHLFREMLQHPAFASKPD